MEIDPERPRSQHLSPEIGQQPMPLGRSVRWPLWALVILLLTASILIVWAALGGTITL